MIDLDAVTFTYSGASRPALRDVTVHIAEGELALVVGRTGAGKSTFLRMINGLVPHFTGGHLEGRVSVAGLDTRDFPPRDLAHVVGFVGQDPLAGFVTDTVEEELAFGMEQLAIPAPVMRKRVEETLDLLGIADLRRRSLRTLSGGQQQRVAIGSVLTLGPRVLVLDEPTSALDPTAAEDALAAITRLVHDLGVTVLMAEHRMERVVQYADRLIIVDSAQPLPATADAEPNTGAVVRDGTPSELLHSSPVVPPVVELARQAGWSPLPLSIRDARRLAGPLRHRLAASDHTSVATTNTVGPQTSPGKAIASPEQGTVALQAWAVVVRYGALVAVRGVDFVIRSGEVTALMGRNGSGKSSLLWAVQGSGPRHSGSVAVGPAGHDPHLLPPAESRRLVGLVPQSAADLLYLESVDLECRAADEESVVNPGTCRGILDQLAPGIDAQQHPRDLSEGQRLALVLAVQLAAAPPVLLLDEPTRGLDYAAKARLAHILQDLLTRGHAVVLATHDVEFVAVVAQRVVVMAEGEIVADGPVAEVIAASPIFAPQVAKVLGSPWLNVEQVRNALAVLDESAPEGTSPVTIPGGTP